LCAETPTHVGVLPAYSDARAVQDRSFRMLCLPTRQERVIKSHPQQHASDIVEKVRNIRFLTSRHKSQREKPETQQGPGDRSKNAT